MEIEQDFKGVIRGWKELLEVTNMKTDRIRYLMIKEEFPKGHLTQIGSRREKVWDRSKVIEWMGKRNA